MKKVLCMIRNQLCVIGVLIIMFLIVVSGNKKEELISYNVSSINSIQAVHLVSKYNPEVVETIYASNISEVLQYGSTNPVIFQGTMTGYGPDCVGCTGYAACPPKTDVRNGNIYVNSKSRDNVVVIDEDSNIELINDSYKKIQESDIDKYNFDLKDDGKKKRYH